MQPSHQELTHRPALWTGQWLHVICLLPLLALVWFIWNALGNPHSLVFWIAVFVPIVHQVFVWLAWRMQFQSSATSRTVGFSTYLVTFFFLFGGRFLALCVLAWLDRGTLELALPLRLIMSGAFTCLGIYAMYSVIRYFGMARAAGADHFYPRYRDMPLVREGIFRFTSNGMYLYAFLLFWAIAVGLDSTAALLVAAFSHAYIWVHFYATEKPDMDFLYSSD